VIEPRTARELCATGDRSAVSQRSAALHWRGRSIGVVLTGDIDDGTAGLVAIKVCGGTTIVQDPATAFRPSMPTSALAHVAVDHCLPLTEIAPVLAQRVREPSPAETLVPPTVVHEQSVFEGHQSVDDMKAIASPSTFTCPDCGGSLWELHDNKSIRHRCHAGHAFGVASLQSQQARDTRPAQGRSVFAGRPDHLPQPAELPESRRPAARARDLPLRAAAAVLAVPGLFGAGRRGQPAVHRPGQEEPDLPAAAAGAGDAAGADCVSNSAVRVGWLRPRSHHSRYHRPAAREAGPQRVHGRWPRHVVGRMRFKLLDALAPPSVLVDADYNIVHLSPAAGRFLRFSGGEPSRNLLRAINSSLRVELRAALYEAGQSVDRAEVVVPSAKLDEESVEMTIRVSQARDVAADLLLVTFDITGSAPPTARAAAPNGADPVARHLDRGLERLQAHLRDTVEQYEASTEELKASNEELQAMNEELRSAPEELETSREELQSINEELTTVNVQLKSKVDELAQSRSGSANARTAAKSRWR
jgi:hypothetical protein